MYKQLLREILREIKKQNIKDQKKLDTLKKKVIKKYKIKKIPANAEILAVASSKERANLKWMGIKPIRTLSGVNVIAIMTKPFNCPHGKCIYCPGGIGSYFGDVPQSYTGKEPATRRAIRNFYDPYLQVFNRLEQYVAINKIPEKVELIIMGGTFPSFPKEYQKEFIYYAFKALNDFGNIFFKDNKLNTKKFNKFFELPGDIENEDRIKRIQNKILKIKNNNNKNINIKNIHKQNESSKIKCVGLTIETRPDYGKLKHGNEMLELGATRVELGIQSIYDDVLKFIERGHTVNDSIESIRILKDLGFKINLHYMPGLTHKKRDLEGMKQLFSNENFRPDMLKIYPCMVLKGTKLYELYKQGKYKPLITKEAAKLIIQFKKYVPKYCRIVRILRDIPTYVTEAGVDKTNLRQDIEEVMKKKGIKCKCIRCRESGFVLKKNKKIKVKKIDILVYHYKASKGIEFFISAEDVKNDILFGICRLRFPSQFLRKEITPDSVLIRDLHVYSSSLPVGEKSKTSYQHRGLGKKLLKKAEEIVKTYRKKKIVVISGIGARPYYAKLGYKRDGPYMSKTI